MPDTPRTLLELAGVRPKIACWEQSVLLLIDTQQEYVIGQLPLSGVADSIRECSRLLALARSQGAPVMHVVHHGRPGSALFNPDGPMVAIIPELRPVSGEQIVIKSLPNAFARTNLDELVRNTGRSELVIAGFATHMCVSSTARSALDHGYMTTVVASACATRDLPAPSGGQIPAAALQQAVLAELADRFATVVPAPDVWQPEIALRAMCDADIAAIRSWPSYPSTFTELDYALREGGWLTQYYGKPHNCCKVAQINGEPIGFALLLQTSGDEAEYRIALHSRYLGQGYGAIISAMMLQHGFEEMGVARIRLIVRKTNPHAWRLYQRLGFQAVGECAMNIQGEQVAFIEMCCHRPLAQACS